MNGTVTLTLLIITFVFVRTGRAWRPYRFWLEDEMNCLPQTRKAAQLAFDCLKHLDLHDELWRRILLSGE
jgi:hypothetical protein